MRLTAIDKKLGVGQSTGQGKSMEMLKIQQFDVDWTQTSRMSDNPLVWMLEVDGFLMDMRNAPRDLQERAFEQGLIPFIPADQDTTTAEQVADSPSAEDDHDEVPAGRLF